VSIQAWNWKLLSMISQANCIVRGV
jgi:hypothetical protein